MVTPPEPKAKRRPLPEAFTDAGRDLTRAAERLTRLTEDDRFAKNRETTHHQVPELLGALGSLKNLCPARAGDSIDDVSSADPIGALSRARGAHALLSHLTQ
ncbi:MAG TPA: hypothetical protein DEQ61_23585 [Streptomyces sp.]|nr:hypothetical protein [Streptomyces sp.]